MLPLLPRFSNANRIFRTPPVPCITLPAAGFAKSCSCKRLKSVSVSPIDFHSLLKEGSSINSRVTLQPPHYYNTLSNRACQQKCDKSICLWMTSIKAIERHFRQLNLRHREGHSAPEHRETALKRTPGHRETALTSYATAQRQDSTWMDFR